MTQMKMPIGVQAKPDGSGKEKPWLQHYPDGVPETIDEKAIGSLADLFLASAEVYSARPVARSFGTSLTYGQLAKEAKAVATWLQAQGLKKGDRVAIMLPNVMAYPTAMFGALLGGFTIVNVNPLYTATELAHQIADSGARILFVLENVAHTVTEAGLDLERIVIVSPGDLLGARGWAVNFISRHVRKAVPPFTLPKAVLFSQMLAEGRRQTMQPVQVGPDDVAFLQYTGGTTGISKGAVLLHRNVAANVAQCETWMRAFIAEGQQVMITALPLYHIFALTICCLLMVRCGGTMVLIANPRDLDGFVKTLKSVRFTMMAGVNTLYAALVRHPGIHEVDFSALTVCVSGGMTTQETVADAWQCLTGRPIVEGYGLSETSPVVSFNRFDIPAFTGTVGYPTPSTIVSVRGPDGEVLAQGETGELCVKGPQVMIGYWHRPKDTAATMTTDGFLRTGDIALITDVGQIRLIDRLKDIVIVSGFNVYPSEVEDVLVRHPSILEAAVVGTRDEKSGEAVVAYVVKNDPTLNEADIYAFCHKYLAAYKVPHRIEFRTELPKSNVGKVLRRQLRDETGT